ncbi:MAG TPA: fumarylacetoacetate hydrolase family protein [Woeseiaceae bacterium]|nr:fumarylacetoacetate hydrolase family protein [Woeseiaceae bacterium]
MFEVARPIVPVSGSDAVFPVHRIYCLGQNYAAHAREMGGDPDRESPFYFMKPGDAVVPEPATVPYPPMTADLHHEVELVVAIGRGGRDLRAGDAASHIFGYAVGVDLTRRELQADAKRRGRPWDAAKGFDHSAPISAIRPVAEIGHPRHARIWLEVNGELRQDGNLRDLIWTIEEAIADLSTLFTLAPGDLLFTGTPAGVGPVARGDRVAGGIDGVGEIAFNIGID